MTGWQLRAQRFETDTDVEQIVTYCVQTFDTDFRYAAIQR